MKHCKPVSSLFLLSDQENIDFNEYHVHVLTSVMKTFFRELPEPLLTYDLYDDFIRASGMCTE